ncbi:MAG: flagellar basal body rod protein FlgB [Ignavibacteria bacterium]|nr:MAG: flagellar basal body rod protein FlgB [Ignavibacteria bacterium]
MSNVNLLKTYLNFLVEKNKKITENIANRESENYRRQDVDFMQFLEQEKANVLASNNPKHIQLPSVDEVNPIIHISSTDEFDIDNGEINIENEMAELAKVTLNFKFASKSINNYYKKLQSVIKGGGTI